jgi:hypothetical protein
MGITPIMDWMKANYGKNYNNFSDMCAQDWYM